VKEGRNMTKYMMVYRGEATPMEDMTPEQGAEIVAKWMTWMEKVGPALSDAGTPFGASISLVDDGTDAVAESLTGYSILEADDLDTAKDLADGHPYLSEGQGNYAIDIFELAPRPFDPPS
jgi:hypothetical protein